MATALVWNMTPWISSYDNDMRFRWAAIALTVFLGLTLPALYESLKAGRQLLNRRQLVVLLTWGICIAVLIPVYLVGFSAWHFYGRYMAPLIVLTFPFIAVLATVATSRLKSVGFSLLALSPVCFAALAASQMHSGHMILDLPINAGFVRAHLDDRRLVGAFQSGTVGYFNGRVVNLDGKIDFQAQYAMSQGRIRAYIDDQQIDVLLDWPQLCELFGDGVSPEEWTACNQQPGGMSRCCERKTRKMIEGEPFEP
jgi:hypothetical protein